MFDLFKSTSAVIGKKTPSEPAARKTKFKFNIKNHVANTLFFAWNDGGYFSRTKGNASKNGGSASRGYLKIADGRDVKLGLALRLEYKSNNGKYGVCKVGKGTAYHEDNNNYSASVYLGFVDSLAEIPKTQTSVPYEYLIEDLNFGKGVIYENYYLNLKEIANGKRYCRIYIYEDPENPDYCLLEGKVHLHIIKGEKNLPIVIYGKESGGKSPEKGWPKDQVVNRDIYIDLQNETEVYLIGLVVPKQNSDKSFTFEVGDPKDDADVDVEEV